MKNVFGENVPDRGLFGGQVGNFRKDFNPPTDLQRAFEKKHLKAFLRGDMNFSFGKDVSGFPEWYPVMRE